MAEDISSITVDFPWFNKTHGLRPIEMGGRCRSKVGCWGLPMAWLSLERSKAWLIAVENPAESRRVLWNGQCFRRLTGSVDFVFFACKRLGLRISTIMGLGWQHTGPFNEVWNKLFPQWFFELNSDKIRVWELEEWHANSGRNVLKHTAVVTAGDP